MAELKPCPFCGGSNLFTVKQKPVSMAECFMVKCFNCSAEIKRSTKRKAIEAWNRRTSREID